MTRPAEATGAATADRKVHWRCFHCGETFTKAQERWAREHFGRDCSAEPVCLIRTAGESALLTALRRAEDDLAEWRSELNPTLNAMSAMACDHAAALRREEEKGYERGLRDGVAEAARAALRSAEGARDDAR